MHPPLTFDFLRSQIVGIDSAFDTPFGRRLMVYCDYTASGRCLLFVEQYLQQLQRIYANTHTEDDLTGRSMSRLLHEAERTIKRAVNAGPQGRIVACGTGATGAIDKLQQILGIALPPATRKVVGDQLRAFMGEARFEEFRRFQQAQQPVVFVGPYEHHSNEVTWRQGLATVVEVNLAADGSVDVEHLRHLLQLPEYQGRLRIGSFSAASNVTGMRSPTREIARLLHAHDAYACFDYAASAPYVEIDMNPAPDVAGGDASYDAVFLSPHKFLGGPGSSGVLVFNERLYKRDLPPSVAGGGTVDYVSPHDQDFIADIEEREKAGTPGVLQTMKAALAMDLKRAIGVERIEAREHALLARAMQQWAQNTSVEILGNLDPARRVGIVSFNLRDARGRYLHPKFVTVLLNDLFGIQSRAGCSCAGPYGHRLLGIDQVTSELTATGCARASRASSQAGAAWDSISRWTMPTRSSSRMPSISLRGTVIASCRCTRSIRRRACGPTASSRSSTRDSPSRRHSRHSVARRRRCPQRSGRDSMRSACARRVSWLRAWASRRQGRAAGSGWSSASCSSSICSAGRRKPGPGPSLRYASSAIAPPACDTSCRANCSARNVSPRSRMK